MANPYFQFKKFRIYHDKCGMKVTQDACVFGAIVPVDNAENILDIGTGTGILSIMLRQRTSANITAIDIDQSAIEQANENLNRTSFASINFEKLSVQSFAKQTKRFDLIISNPPYFQGQDTKKNAEQYNNARHGISLQFDDLADSVSALLTAKGTFWTILPIYEFNKLEIELNKYGLFKTTEITLQHSSTAKNKRIIAEFSRTAATCASKSVTIRNKDNTYTKEFKNLMQEYYSIF